MNLKNVQVRELRGSDEIAKAAAVELLGLLKRRPSSSLPFGIALSGGRIAAPFYDAVALGADASPTSFENVHFFWADERCVPPDDPENNYRTARKHLFEPLGIDEASIHRIRGEVDVGYAVREAEAELCRVMPLTAEGQPILDLAILGMGEDGHTASLFPEEDPSLFSDARVFRDVVATKPPPRRITLGYQPLLAAREVLVLVPGAGKKSVLDRALAGDNALPIARIFEARPKTIVLRERSQGE